MKILRLRRHDTERARTLFVLMAQVFEEDCTPPGDAYLSRLLGRDDFWALAAMIRGEIVGGLTAHVLPMTRGEFSELFIYDIAVRADHQRKGVGRQLMTALREQAAAEGIRELFVPADNDDRDALDFYRALGGVPSPVTFFTFGAAEQGGLHRSELERDIDDRGPLP